MTTFSVVIATRNRSALLAQTLAALAQQTWPRRRWEIIVADNGSSDNTRATVARAAARAYAPVIRYLLVEQPGKSAAVNAALRLAKHDVIAFTDDDVLPGATWLERLAAAIADTGADFVAGRVLPLWEMPRPAWLSPALFGVIAVPDNGDERVLIDRDTTVPIMTIGANMAVTRAVVERIGGLRNDFGKLEGSLRGGEDHEYFLRMIHAGCRGVYEPTASVHHRVPGSRLSKAYFRRWLYRNGRDVARLEPSYPSSAVQLFRLPRYLWRQAGADVLTLTASTLVGHTAARFRAVGRLLWLAGYARETWFAGRSTPAGGLPFPSRVE